MVVLVPVALGRGALLPLLQVQRARVLLFSFLSVRLRDCDTEDCSQFPPHFTPLFHLLCLCRPLLLYRTLPLYDLWHDLLLSPPRSRTVISSTPGGQQRSVRPFRAPRTRPRPPSYFTLRYRLPRIHQLLIVHQNLTPVVLPVPLERLQHLPLVMAPPAVP